jgi:glucose/arabinose dehydrogenase
VGQNKFEEINIIQKGKNYGWRIMEGNHCYNPKENCPTKNLELPIAEYGRDKGISVTGGFVYRGKNIPALEGKYIFGDWKGKMYYLEEAGGKWVMQDMVIEGKKNNDLDFDINSFGEDENGEIYILVQKLTGTFASNGQVLLIESGKKTK